MSHPVDPTFRLNAPFRTDFGRNEHDTQGAVKRGREGGDHTEYGHADRGANDTARDLLEQCPAIDLIDIDHYDLDTFNDCAESGDLLISKPT